MANVIDIHCHILPSVDDGASSLMESLMMAREAEKQGIKRIIATPHHHNGEFMNPGEHIPGIVHYLNGKLREEKIQVEILPGQETKIYGELVADLKSGNVITLNGSNYVLIGLPRTHVPHYTTQLFFDLQIDGYTPIIAQPELNQEILENPDKLYRLVKNGALTQMKAGSIIGQANRKIQEFTHQLLQSNLTHFIASDAHDGKGRSHSMHKAYQEIVKVHGESTAEQLQENSESLVMDQSIHKNMPERIRKKKIWGIFGR